MDNSKRDHIAIALACCVVHALLLVNDGVFWDGWLVSSYLTESRWDLLHDGIFLPAGRPLQSWMHWVMRYAPEPVFAYRLVTFFSLVSAAFLVYEIGRELRLGPQVSLLTALVSLSFPAYQVSIEIMVMPYTLGYALFLLGCYLGLACSQFGGSRGRILRVGSLLSFLLSYTIESLVAFYLGFLIILGWARVQSGHGASRHRPWEVLKMHWDFITLPFAYLIVLKLFFPRYGEYADLNQIQLSPGSITFSAWQFLSVGIYEQIRVSFLQLVAQPVLVLASILAGSLAYMASRKSRPVQGSAQLSPGGQAAFGLLWLVLGVAPYVLAGKGPALQGWDTRHALLVALPLAVLLTAFIRQFLIQANGRMSFLGYLSISFMLFSFAVRSNLTYLDWQARVVKDRSILANLKGLRVWQKTSVFWIKDAFLVHPEFYRFYEWSSMFKQAWSTESSIGLSSSYNASHLLTLKPYFGPSHNLSNFDPSGCQAILTISRGHFAADNAAMAKRYLLTRLFHPEQIGEYLAGVTTLEVQSLPSPAATGCL